MKNIVVVLTFLLSFGAEAGEQVTKPKCTNIRFTGIAIHPSGGTCRAISRILARRDIDIDDVLARNPFLYSSNPEMGMPEYSGFAMLKHHKGRIVDWDNECFIIHTTLDFNTGRKDVELTVRRKDALCVK